MTHVAIIGAGIGGLTLYQALKHQGIEADLYEAAPVLHEVGAGIVMACNAMQIFARLGLDKLVLERGWRLDQFQFRDIRGEMLQNIHLTRYEKRYGYGSVAIHRAALQRLLAEGIHPQHLHLGKKCTRISTNDDAAEVAFSDGTTRRAQVIVSADGVHSVARQQLFPAQRLRYAGEVVYRGVLSFDLPPELAHNAWEIWGQGCRFGFFHIGEGQAFWFAGVVAPPGGTGTPETIAQELRDRSAVFPAPIPQLVAATAPEAIFRHDLYDVFPPLKTWHRGRVVLLGDAAHAPTPNTGQGAAGAIEDAYVLASALRHQPTPEAAFRAFEKIRRPKANEIVRSSWLLGKLSQAHSPVAQRVRNGVMKSIPDFVNHWQIDRLFHLPYLRKT